MSKPLPLSARTITQLCAHHPTPFYLYDGPAICSNATNLQNAFRWVCDENGIEGGFTNYFAVKALPNPHILRMLRAGGSGVDCSSMAELLLAERSGFTGQEIFFTSNNTPWEEYSKAIALNARINLDDIGHLDFIRRHDRLPPWISFRYNPGARRQGNKIIGVPQQSKFGLTHKQLFDAYMRAREYGVTNFGLHTMIASNELDPRYFIETARMLFDIVVELHQRCGIHVRMVNLGGGMGIPYRPNERGLNYKHLSRSIQRAYDASIRAHGLHPVRIVTENGRIITGPHGYLISTIRHIKQSYKNFIGLDATMANLMRPAMYGAYHHITILGRTGKRTRYDITGSLCENNDKFAIDRLLPRPEVGDIVIIHDAGAHGHAMGFNYNGKLRSAELLLTSNGDIKTIRTAENYENYFSTLDFSPLNH